MSRRRRGRPQHRASAGLEAPRRPSGQPTIAPTGEGHGLRTAATAPSRVADPDLPGPVPGPRSVPSPDSAIPSDPGPSEAEFKAEPKAVPPAVAVDRAAAASLSGAPGPVVTASGPAQAERPGQCTAPQLRRFIKSRPYVPMHELRRRFSINGEDDDVTAVHLEPGMVYLGLPDHEGRLLGDLLRTGEIGYELSLDPRSPIVIGVYPMRPIPRP